MSDENQTKPKQKSYSNLEVRDMVKEWLKEAKISFISVKVSSETITVEQSGEHESASSMASMFEKPGVFGFDEDNEDGSEVKVRYEEEYGNIVRTWNIFSRYAAEPMYENEGSEEAQETDENTSEESTVPETPEDVMKLTVPELDELLEAHGTDPKTVVGNKKVKQDLVIKIMFSLDD